MIQRQMKHRVTLCALLCAEVNVRQKNDTLLSIETPFFFADGDPYQIYIKELAGGLIRLTDMGHTMMHLSYENDLEKLREGTRGKLFEQMMTQVTDE
jgi:hypothetical protein